MLCCLFVCLVFIRSDPYFQLHLQNQIVICGFGLKDLDSYWGFVGLNYSLFFLCSFIIYILVYELEALSLFIS